MILVVDEDIAFLELASKILNSDRKVFLAINAKQAFQLAEHLGFSVALVDLDMKGTEGLELIGQLRRQFPEMPVIAISTKLENDEITEAMKLGISDILQKPITPDWKPIVERVRAAKRG